VAEAVHGAGGRYGRVLGVTLGTGLGAALVDGPRVVGRAGDVVAADLYREPVGDGSADDCFSARGLRSLLEEAGVSPRDLAAAADDPAAAPVFLEFGRRLGRFLAPRLTATGAEVLVVAGGIAGSFHLFSESLQAEVPVPVRAGELGAAAGVIGAASLFD
jgi:glucokinase